MNSSCSDSIYDITCRASARHEKVKCLMLSYGTVGLVPNAWCLALILDSNCIIAKDVKSCTYCWYYKRCATLIVEIGLMPWPQTGATHFHAQLALAGSINYGNLWTSARCMVWLLVVVRMAIKMKYYNTP